MRKKEDKRLRKSCYIDGKRREQKEIVRKGSKMEREKERKSESIYHFDRMKFRERKSCDKERDKLEEIDSYTELERAVIKNDKKEKEREK